MKKKTKPRFSIVIPCYNEALFIDETLKSLQNQTFKGNVEVIVVDNNCSDNTVKIATSYGAKVISESKPGVCSARQSGTASASGQIIVSTDADTTFKKDWLENIDQIFHEENCVAVAGPCAYIRGPWWSKIYPKLLFGTVDIVYKLIGRPFYVTATNIAFNKDAWDGYDTVLTQGGDELALLHDLEKKGRVVFDRSNFVFTSARRLYRGLIYNIFVTFFYRYMLAYYLNKIFKRTVIGMAPPYRTTQSYSKWRTLGYRSANITAIITLLAIIHIPGKDTVFQQASETFGVIIKTIRSLI